MTEPTPLLRAAIGFAYVGGAAFVAAVSAVEENGSISFLITGDEEGLAQDGTK